MDTIPGKMDQLIPVSLTKAAAILLLVFCPEQLENPPDALVRLLGAGRSVDEESADTVDSDPQGGAYLPHAFVTQPSQAIYEHGD